MERRMKEESDIAGLLRGWEGLASAETGKLKNWVDRLSTFHQSFYKESISCWNGRMTPKVATRIMAVVLEQDRIQVSPPPFPDSRRS
jgi:hypothetical protein